MNDDSARQADQMRAITRTLPSRRAPEPNPQINAAKTDSGDQEGQCQVRAVQFAHLRLTTPFRRPVTSERFLGNRVVGTSSRH